MKPIVKAAKLFALGCLIALAVFGIGLSGAAPTSSTSKRENQTEIKIELVESREEDLDSKESKDADQWE